MFAKTIIDSDAFLDMPSSARLLYYDLGMRADDDGFCNSPKKIMRISGASEDDIKLLIAKKFIIPFESGIIVIKHWRINNFIAKDRYTETKYKEEKATLSLDENKAYTSTKCIHSVNGMDTQVRLGKVSIGNKRLFVQDSFELRLAEQLKNYILKNNPNARVPSDLQKWAREFDLMMRLDKRTAEQINAVMEFSQNDSFWMSNILSAGKLREQFDKLWLQKSRKNQPQKSTHEKNMDTMQEWLAESEAEDAKD